MKILLSSYAFYPSIGGLEAVSAMLAEQFCLRGHEVAIITQTPGQWLTTAYRVVRRPTAWQLLQLVRWCDVCLHNNINLRSAWPLLTVRRPWIIINAGSVVAEGWRSQLKRVCAGFGTPVGVSVDAAHKIGTEAVIPNCYDDDLYRELNQEKRERELMFVGRLVSEKGVDILLSALSMLKDEGITPKLTIVGGGPEEDGLRGLTASLGLEAQVRFAGIKRNGELVRELNRHKIVVVPSRYHEPFGIVALEAIACGCVVIGSQGGGLGGAIGPCGLTFPNGDAAGLASCLKQALLDGENTAVLRRPAKMHLANFTKAAVADAYLNLMGEICLKRP